MYSIDGGATQVSGTFSGLAEGSYTVTIVDDNGCTEDVPVTITEPDDLTGAITSQTDLGCNGNTTGESLLQQMLEQEHHLIYIL